jgi:plastocyanin
MRPLPVLAAIALLAPLALAGSAPSPSAQALPTTIDVTVFTGYVAPVVAIPLGGTVSFANIDFTGQHHTATTLYTTCTGCGFDTGHFVPGQTVTVTPKAAGTYLFKCQIHPWIYGVLVVQ